MLEDYLYEQSSVDVDPDTYEEEDEWEDFGDESMKTSFVCEDCDYRWEDFSDEDEPDFAQQLEDGVVSCPMCGSMSIARI